MSTSPFTRKQLLDGLAAAAYTGPTSYSVEKLYSIYCAVMQGNLPEAPAREPRPTPQPRQPKPVSEVKAKRLERNPWEAGKLSHSRLQTLEAKATVPGQECPGEFHATHITLADKTAGRFTQRCRGGKQCEEMHAHAA